MTGGGVFVGLLAAATTSLCGSVGLCLSSLPSLLKQRRNNSLTAQPVTEAADSHTGMTLWNLVFQARSTIPTSLIPRPPSEPPRAIGAVILSLAVAQFHPAANHFVSTQAELPDPCGRTASVSRKRPSWETSRLSLESARGG